MKTSKNEWIETYSIEKEKIPIYKDHYYVCKKTITYMNDNLIQDGKSYKVVEIDNLNLKIDTLFGEFQMSRSTFSSASPFLFYEYFYTTQESRKLKLEKINENRRFAFM